MAVESVIGHIRDHHLNIFWACHQTKLYRGTHTRLETAHKSNLLFLSLPKIMNLSALFEASFCLHRTLDIGQILPYALMARAAVRFHDGILASGSAPTQLSTDSQAVEHRTELSPS